MNQKENKKRLIIDICVIVVVLILLTITLLFSDSLKNKNLKNSTEQSNSTITTKTTKSYYTSMTNSTKSTTTKTNNSKHEKHPENVTIKIDKNTISRTNISIIITDTNKNHYMYGVKFIVQKKINGNWVNLEYAVDNPKWKAIAYKPNEKNQLIQNLDIKEYYGELSNGVYRIGKTLLDDNRTDMFSDEFEIK